MGHPKAFWVLGKEPGIDTYHSKRGISCGKRPYMQNTAAMETQGREQLLHKALEIKSIKRGEGMPQATVPRGHLRA